MCEYAFVRRCFVMNMDVSICARTRVKTQMGRGGVRAKGRAGKHYSPGRDGAGRVEVRGREREEKTERDPRRGVTLPNHQDGGKARSGCRGSSDRSKQHL